MLERLWAGWRNDYVSGSGDGEGGSGEGGSAGGGSGPHPCVFCRILASGEPDHVTKTLWHGERCIVLLNAFPYTSGHLMVVPRRHVGALEDLDAGEGAEIWGALTEAVRALKAAYRPEGVNVGINLGRAAGAGVPGHFHVHALPRWNGDTNFMTSVAETRVMPESLDATWHKLRGAWPPSPAASA